MVLRRTLQRDLRSRRQLLGDLFWKGGDQKLIDGLGPDGVSAVSYAIGRRTGRFQSGYVYHYAFVMLVGVVALLPTACGSSRGSSLAMVGILSLVTFLPLVGVAAILALKVFAADDARAPARRAGSRSP